MHDKAGHLIGYASNDDRNHDDVMQQWSLLMAMVEHDPSRLSRSTGSELKF